MHTLYGTLMMIVWLRDGSQAAHEQIIWPATICSLKSSWSYLDSWLWGGHPMQILANSKLAPPDTPPPSSNTYFVLQFRNHMFSKIVLNLFGCMTLRGPSPGEKSGIHSDTCQLKVRHTLSCNLGTTCSPKSCWIYLDAWIWGVHPREKKAGFM